MATKSKQIKVSSFSDEFMGNRSQIHPHSKLPKDKLKSLKLRNKCICIVDGLPKNITIDELKSPEWYGRFRKIIKIEIKTHKKKDSDNINATAWITFHNQRPRDDAIEYTNNLYFDDGRILKATHGYNYYCKHFINNKKCSKKNCHDIHEWVYDLKEDIFSYNAWNNYLSRPCGILPDSNYAPRKNVGNNMFETGSRKIGSRNNKVTRSSDKCHKCGGIGHWARDCAKINSYFNDKFMSMSNESKHRNGNYNYEDKEQLLSQELDGMQYEYGALLQKYEDLLIRKHANDEKIDELQDENDKLKSEIVKYQQSGINPMNNEMKKQMILEVHNMRQQMIELKQTNEKLRNSVQELSINNEKMKHENETLRNRQTQNMENTSDEGKGGKKRRKRKRRRSKGQMEHDYDQEQGQNDDGLKARILELEKDNKQKEVEVEEWKGRCGLLMRQRNDLNGQLNTLQDDFKELEIKYNELESKCNETMKSDWKLWDAMDIVNWIIGLNKERYSEYKDRLAVSFVKEEIDGSCLKDMDKNDLHRLGITRFKDKRDVFEEIQQLTQKMMTNDGLNNVYNEGKITPIV